MYMVSVENGTNKLLKLHQKNLRERFMLKTSDQTNKTLDVFYTNCVRDINLNFRQEKQNLFVETTCFSVNFRPEKINILCTIYVKQVCLYSKFY